ncbi:CHAT domain-containing protein [Tenacibaculum geojense]|uniref:CHAT domain-containing protein n=1 Tax=Tenacibaculum geojense TaxID=915352 RepID=A0ABW3JNW9_9FLAO
MKNAKNNLLLLILLFTTNSFSQNYFENYNKNNKNYKESEIDSLFAYSKDAIEVKILEADYYSVYFYRKGRVDLAIKYADLGISLCKSINKKDQHYIHILYYNGLFNHKLGYCKNAIKHYLELINQNNYPVYKGLAFAELGRCYRDNGDFYRALDYYSKAIPILKKEEAFRSLFNTYIYNVNTFILIRDKESINKALNLLSNLDEIINDIDDLKSDKNNYIVNNALGNAHLILSDLELKENESPINNFSKSSVFFKKSLYFANKIVDSTRISLAYNNLGRLNLLKNNDSARLYLNNSLKFSINSSHTKALSTQNLSEYYLKHKDYDSALEYINKSIDLTLGFEYSKGKDLIDHSKLINVKNKIYLIGFLKRKAQVLIKRYEDKKNKEDLFSAISLLKTCDIVSNYIIGESTNIDSKLNWRETMSDVYFLGVEASEYLKDYNSMLYFIEKNKAELLLSEIKSQSGLTMLPVKITNSIRNFKNKIFKIEEAISFDSKQNIILRDSLLDIKLNFNRFKDSVSQFYPSTFNKKFEFKQSEINHIQSSIDDDSVFISFITNRIDLDKEKLFILVVTKQNVYCYKTTDYSGLKNNIEDYQKYLSKPLQTKSEFKDFNILSNILFNSFFPTEEIRNVLREKRRLIISPDISFENLPFETLCENNKDLAYLLLNHDLEYTYSWSFFTKENNNLKNNNSNKLLGIAPVSFFDSSHDELLSTQKEVEKLSKKFNSEVFLNKEATKENFLAKVNEFNLIHLATHSKPGKSPEIYFYKDTLKVNELYGLNIQADLVTLSACKTNLGELKKGEGVFSLSRGFFTSGVKAVVSSLWNVNDKSTTYIMNHFYDGLNKNKTKSQALNDAKRTYLLNHTLSDQSPYYWASFVITGDVSAINNYSYKNIIVVVLITFLTLLFIFYKKRG